MHLDLDCPSPRLERTGQKAGCRLDARRNVEATLALQARLGLATPDDHPLGRAPTVPGPPAAERVEKRQDQQVFYPADPLRRVTQRDLQPSAARRDVKRKGQDLLVVGGAKRPLEMIGRSSGVHGHRLPPTYSNTITPLAGSVTGPLTGLSPSNRSRYARGSVIVCACSL